MFQISGKGCRGKSMKGGTDADRPARELRTHIRKVGEKHECLRNISAGVMV
jgi:hypothetical protein